MGAQASCLRIAGISAGSLDFGTSLDLLLKHLGADTLILAGFTADICILFTANDAYMRDYRLLIPSDCVASQDEKENQRALKFMERVLKADIRATKEINPNELSSTVKKRALTASGIPS